MSKKILLFLPLIFSIYSVEIQNDNLMTQEEKEYLASLEQQIDAKINKMRDAVLHEVIEKTEQDIDEYNKCKEEYESSLIAWAEGSDVKALKPVCNCRRRGISVKSYPNKKSHTSDWNKNQAERNKVLIYEAFSKFTKCVRTNENHCYRIFMYGDDPLIPSKLESEVYDLESLLQDLLKSRKDLLAKIALRKKLHQQAAKIN